MTLLPVCGKHWPGPTSDPFAPAQAAVHPHYLPSGWWFSAFTTNPLSARFASHGLFCLLNQLHNPQQEPQRCKKQNETKTKPQTSCGWGGGLRPDGMSPGCQLKEGVGWLQRALRAGCFALYFSAERKWELTCLSLRKSCLHLPPARCTQALLRGKCQQVQCACVRVHINAIPVHVTSLCS